MAGVGQHVDISIMECISSSLEDTLPLTSYIGDDHNRHRAGNRRSPVVGLYPCRDGHIGIHANPREWPKVAEGIGRPELVNDTRFMTPAARQEHRDELEAIILAWTTDNDKETIHEIAGKLRVPFAPVLTTKELLESPQLRAREFFVEIDHPETGPLVYPGAPFRMSETPWEIKRAPLLGEHNEEIYCGRLGYTRKDVALLRRQGVI